MMCLKINAKVQMMLLLAFMLCVNVAHAESGLKIFKEAAKRDAGYGDYEASVIMTLHRKSEDTRIRKMKIVNLEVMGDGFRTMITFKDPPDVSGTKILTETHLNQENEQWIYLPAFHRVKQISSANKTSSFMGSEFTYEDINALNIVVPKYSYKYVKKDTISGITCYEILRTPNYRNSAYSKEVVWIDTNHYTIQKIDFYGKNEALLKTLLITGYKKYLKKYFRAMRMKMLNHKNGNITMLDWKDYDFSAGYTKQDLSVSALAR